MITKFNTGNRVITGYGKTGIITSIVINKEKCKYLVAHDDNTETWHEEHDINIIIGDQYLTEHSTII